MKKSLSLKIENYYKKLDCWIHKGTIESLAKETTYYRRGVACHYLADNATRCLRRLAEDGILERDPNRAGYYRYKRQRI